MQVFAIDKDPIVCAMALDDTRVNKMSIEAAQILSTAAMLNGSCHPKLCKMTHKYHPLVVWARNQANYNWLYSHYLALCFEFKKRRGYYGKIYERAEALQTFVKGTSDEVRFINCAENKAYEISFKEVEDIHLAYKLYLNERWKHDKRTPTWFNSKQPDWGNYENVDRNKGT